MFNIVVTFLFFLLIPGFFKGSVGFEANNLKNKIGAVPQEQKVLGVEEEKDSLGKNNPDAEVGSDAQDIFSNKTGNMGIVPTRKKNCSDLKTWAGASVSIDVSSGTILHYDNGRKQTQIASLTKMMTAILAMENIKDFNEEVVIPKEALQVDGTIVGCPTSVFCNGNRMFVGEKVHAIDLLKAMLLNSANDAATSLGIHIAGSKEKFVAMMNQRARDLGLIDTHFCTPSGLEIENRENECYSSAYDIARIGAESMKYELIWETMKISEGQFFSTDGKRMHLLKNTDLLLGNISNCLGGKTGFTPLAGKSLLLGSTDATGKHKIISVLLNDEKRWEDMRTLVSWVNASYEWK
jgi:serine-type D-Ala-D-Ala carboxypeptidase (penicillin-binding protein 5/6)